jgi:rhamnose utilization protein RhaD (predicted bifunctional aldolase and dehydrogenase)
MILDMNNTTDNLKFSVVEYCSIIGADPLLVQGAGGNVSWKDGDTLWVKASGTWLAEANEKDIFVPVDLLHLRTAIENDDFSITPKLHGEFILRPSIETLLHALMPHRVVVHLHPIEILAYLVRDNYITDFQLLLDTSIHWTTVEYFKPGDALASAVSAALARESNIDVVFLKNHGVVIGGADVTEVSCTLKKLTSTLSTPLASSHSKSLPILQTTSCQYDQYTLTQDADVQQLAFNTELFNRLASDWALYPDHVVFLGVRAYAYRSWIAFQEDNMNMEEQPELIFILGDGVYVRPTFNDAKHAQLRCYYDVLARQIRHPSINALTDAQISELLNWDAEKYRQALAK